MKVLCLWYQPPDARPAPFMRPMLRIESAFRKFGIIMQVKRVTCTATADKALAGEYDVLLLHEAPLYEPALDCGRPVIFLERLDGAQLRRSRNYLHRIKGVIKGYVFRDRGWYNCVNDRAHVNFLHTAGIRPERPLYSGELPAPFVRVGDLQNIRAGYGFGAWDNMAAAVDTKKVDFDDARVYDVQFLGTVDYERTEVEAHRRLALRAALNWPGVRLAAPGRPLRREPLYKSILLSKTVLCPWGWGEATHREYEAMLLGAVVIKPSMDHVDAWPQIYRAGETYVRCRPDFSDAHEKIAEVTGNWRDYRSMRETARQEIVNAWPAEAIAGRMTTLIKELTAKE